MSDTPPEFDRKAFLQAMEEPMRWAQLEVSYQEISDECKTLVLNMANYSLESALSVLAGFLTLPTYQSHCIRLEILVALATLHCRGKKKASIGTAVCWFKKIGETRCVLGEDPSEDVFVSLVHNEQGNYRLLEGLWENSGFFTQCFSNIVVSLPNEEPFTFLKSVFTAVLKISEAICDRAGLERYQLGNDLRMAKMNPADIPKYSELTKFATFTSSELEEIGVSATDISPILSRAHDLSDILEQAPGESRLELRPLVQVGANKFVFALPSAVSICARNLVIDFMSDCQLEHNFDRALAKTLADQIYNTPILGSMFRAPVRWQKIGDIQYAAFSNDFDEGFTLSVHLFLPPVSTHHSGGFKTLYEDD